MIPTHDASREPGSLAFDVRLHDDRLSGSVSALGTNVYALSSYVSLERRRDRPSPPTMRPGYSALRAIRGSIPAARTAGIAAANAADPPSSSTERAVTIGSWAPTP